MTRFLTVDPGEDTGWSLWNGSSLVDSGTTKMWHFSDSLWHYGLDIVGVDDAVLETHTNPADPDLVGLLHATGIEELVTENWTLYPWKLQDHSLDWDECRTARLIGSMYSLCRIAGWKYIQQPATIKERALAAGAESFFSHPLRENRHANDAIMHGVYYNAMKAGASWTDLSQREWSE